MADGVGAKGVIAESNSETGHTQERGVETATVDVRPYHHPAAGLGAIASTLKHAMHEMGVIRSASTLLK
ncbi:hypothetical protein ACYOEI_11615, partial [Singulisphaera rosea]